MYLETERLILRSMLLSDEKAFLEMASDGSLDKDIFPGRPAAYHTWMRAWIADAIKMDKQDNPADWMAFTIEERKSGVPVGSVGCTYYDDLKANGLVYFIGAAHRGNGYAAEAAAAYAEYFLARYEVPELTLTIRAENKASCKTAEKAGFTLVETKLYQDFNDDTPCLYHFYTITNASR